MKKKELYILRILLALSDLALLNMCLFVAFYLVNKLGTSVDGSVYFRNILPVNAIWLLSTGFFRLYSEQTVHKLKDIYKATWRCTLLFCLTVYVYIFFTSSGLFPKEFMFAFSFLVIISFLLSRLSYINFERLLNFHTKPRKETILAIASVGGHWIELLRLMPLFKEHEVTFVSNKANLAHSVEGNNFFVVPDANRNNPFKMVQCFFTLFNYVLLSRPRVVITTGAAPGLMGIVIGRMLGIKTIWIDSIANVDELSLSGHIATKIADKVYTQWEHLSTPRIAFNGNLLK